MPPRATEGEILAFVNAVVTHALAPHVPPTPPATRIYLNSEKCYAFVEFDSIELASACMALDGIRFDHPTGTTILRVRRPNDYRPDLLPPSGPLPKLNLEVLGAAGATMTDGPGKLFVGGLPYALTDEQVLELLSAFGPIKNFHQVRDPGSTTSKGYGFCEYERSEDAEQAIAGLNGMALGDKTLTVRYSVPSSNTSSSSSNNNPALQQQQQLLQLQQLQLQSLGGLGGAALGAAALGANPLLAGLSNIVAPVSAATKVKITSRDVLMRNCEPLYT